MAVVQNLMVRAGADFSGLTNGLRQAQQETESFGTRFKGAMAKVGIGIAAVGVAAIGFGKQMIEASADSQALQSQYSQVMGKMKADTDKYLNGMAKAWNKHPNELKSAYLQYVAILKSKGVAEKDAHKLAKETLDRTIDANAFANEDMATTAARFMAGIKGEYDSLDTALVNLSATMMNDIAIKEYGKKFDELNVTQQETLKAQEMLRQQTAAGIFGQGVREADSYANNLAMVKAQWAALMAKFGDKMLPTVNKILKEIADNLPRLYDKLKLIYAKLQENGTIERANKAWGVFKGLMKWCYDNLGTIAALIAGVTSKIVAQLILTELVALYKAWKTATTAMTTAQWLLNTAMSANPIGLIATAIGLLVTAFILAYNNSKTFRKGVDDLFKTITNGIKHLTDMWDWVVKIGKAVGRGDWKQAFFELTAGGTTKGKGSTKVTHRPNIGRLPSYASGTITSRPHFALVGDNPGGREVIQPQDKLMSLISTAVATGLQANRGTNAASGDIVLNLDGRQFARIIKPFTNLETIRTGKNIRMNGI